jgi:hypothetical protein
MSACLKGASPTGLGCLCYETAGCWVGTSDLSPWRPLAGEGVEMNLHGTSKVRDAGLEPATCRRGDRWPERAWK